jgi:bile acid:Na+ symporter, BASS family
MGTMLWPTDKILLLIYIVFAMMSITLEATLRQIAAALRNRALVARALLINFVLVPLLAIVLVQVVPMAQDVKDGILLLAVVPGDFLAFNFTRKLCARIELPAAVLFLLTFVGVLLAPVSAHWILQSQLPVSVPYAKVIKVVLVYVALPLIAGLALNRWFPKLATGLQKPFTVLSALAFIGFTISTGSTKTAAAKTIAGGGALLGLALFILGGMILGWFLGDSDRETRGVMSLSSGLRSFAICLAIAAETFPDSNVDLTIIASAALGIPMALVFTAYQAQKRKKKIAAHSLAGAA